DVAGEHEHVDVRGVERAQEPLAPIGVHLEVQVRHDLQLHWWVIIVSGNIREGSMSLHDISAKTIDGETLNLGDYKGKVVLVVNTASQCGSTPQYAGLEGLWRHYRDRGLVVLGFPSNDFGAQEPGDEAEIKDFCTSKYHVSFPMFAKVKVTGAEQSPVFRFL